MGSNLNGHQFNIDCYVQKRLYTNLMTTTNQKPLINMQRIKRKKSKYIAKENQQNMKERPERIRENLNNHKTRNKMTDDSTHISINTYFEWR